MNTRRAALLGIVLAAALAALQPASAAPVRWLAVQLGTHRFGHLRTPDAIVARAGAKEVGFECGRPSACPGAEPPASGGCGCIDVLPQGPTSFDVARDGSIWLLDGVKRRLLVWRAGRPAHPARSVSLPAGLDAGDFALGPDGTIYTYSTHNVAHRRNHMLYALTPAGHVRWKAPSAIETSNPALRVGPDGTLYAVGAIGDLSAWTPLTTPTGHPLPLTKQRLRTRRFQPLAGGLRLITTQPTSREVRITLRDQTDRVVRAWRITSRTALGSTRTSSGMVSGDLVVVLDVSRQALWERLVLRLGAQGVRQSFALDGRAVWDPDGTAAGAPVRVGPDGRLYQLRTNPTTGVSVASYSLGGRGLQ